AFRARFSLRCLSRLAAGIFVTAASCVPYVAGRGWHTPRFATSGMRHRAQRDRLASYIVILDPGTTDLTEFAAYLTTIAVAGFEVIVAELPAAFEENDRGLRWVGHHVRTRPQHRSFSGAIDPLRVAMDVATCDKVVVADER